MPYVEQKPFERDFHLSYHASGEFHWTDNGIHVDPLCGEDDFRKAFEVWLKLRFPPCLCIRKGKGLREEEIISLVRCLSRYVPVVNIEDASQELKRADFYRLVSADADLATESDNKKCKYE
ncbi:hypothetical protein ES703_118027 [subsurface metagenome]